MMEAEQAEPCPNCGERGRNIHVEVADAVGAADDVSVRAEFGERPWEEKWSEVTRLLAEIEAIYANRGSIDVARGTVEGFFKAARELADWIKAKTGKNALVFVNNDAEMAIPDAFAQTLKHHTRTKAGSISARIASIDTALPGTRVEIAWSTSGGPETLVDALDLARATVAAWRRYAVKEGLTPPT
ncbi:hypothetical protein ACQP2X_22540 [Actinoplanes sp. CA-131856]